MPIRAAAQGSTLPAAPHLRVEVSQETINKSCVADSSHCMIAESVRRCYPWARNVTVDVQTIRLSDPESGVRFTYLTPRQAQIALLDFDAGEPPEPFIFQLPRRTAHVSWMKRQPATRTLTQAQQDAVRANLAEARKYNPKLKDRKTLAVKKNGDHEAVTPAGGLRPPLGALAAGSVGRKRDGNIPTARRRTYGLRAMDRRSTVVAPE